MIKKEECANCAYCNSYAYNRNIPYCRIHSVIGFDKIDTENCFVKKRVTINEPCPFCDSRIVIAYHYTKDKDHEIEVCINDLDKVDYYWIRCRDCGMEVHSKAMELSEFIRRFDTRKPIEKLKDTEYELRQSEKPWIATGCY